MQSNSSSVGCKSLLKHALKSSGVCIAERLVSPACPTEPLVKGLLLLLTDRGEEEGSSAPKLEHAKMRNKKLKRDGEAHNM